jgi:crotonobetainyl-CoA:carnitine CoA-transferase CaiB-like acyl-CoA transferase
MARDSKYASNAQRVVHEQEIDQLLNNWCAIHNLAAAMEILEQHRVPCGPVYSVADMVADEHFKQRGLFEQVEINGQPLKIPAIMPKLADTPGTTDWPGPEIASHTDEILQELGLDAEQIAGLKTAGVVTDSE